MSDQEALFPLDVVVAVPRVRERSVLLDYHAARVLLLLASFDEIKGLTKLAKLDFLLRYPVMLERLAGRLPSEISNLIQPTEVERLAVESKMIRYKYGPWDDKYYPMLGVLIGMGLVTSKRLKTNGRIDIRIAPAGREVTRLLGAHEAWSLIEDRCKFLASDFDYTGNELKEMIYRHLPDVVNRPLREEI